MTNSDWSEIRKLWKGPRHNQVRLLDSSGALVSSEQRAETLAEHLQRVQWAVRPVTLTPHKGEEAILQVEMGSITEPEVIAASKALKNNRAAGRDEIPAEFWKSVLLPGSEAARCMTLFCDSC